MAWSRETDTPVVSIVLCVWKPRLDWFRQAVASALDQRDCDLELIVVDDGSPEPVSQLLLDVEDPRLRVIRIDHGGLAHARNEGTRVARGRFLRFADADDVLERASTARLQRLAADGAIAYGSTLLCDEQLRPLGIKSSHLQGWIAEQCLLYRFDVRHMSMLFPRQVVDAVGEWETTLRQCQDWDFVLRALEQAPVRGEPDIATYYRRHGGSASANVAGALEYESRVVDRYFERHPEQAGTDLEREARAKLLLVRAKACPAMGRRRRDQLGLIVRALRLHRRRVLAELAREAAGHAVRNGTRLFGVAQLLQSVFIGAARELTWAAVVPLLRVRARRKIGDLRAGEVTVVTVNWNSAQYLRVLLRLVRARSSKSVKMLVVDNASRDGSRELLAREKEVGCVRLPLNLGHDLALDIGFLRVDTEFVVALDVDAFPLHENWVAELLAPLAAGCEISGARLNREYVHPCCLAMRTRRFVERKHSFRSRYRPRIDGRDASGDVGEEMSAREHGKLHFFERTSRRGPGDVGSVFGDLVYHNYYATRFSATTDQLLDGRVGRDDPSAAWEEALARYGD
jgi:glycosyltransferase involved in cell wall biosynthesis